MGPIKAVFSYGKATVHLEGEADDIQRCLESGSVSKHLMTAASGTRSQPDALDDETFERALDHGWEWFALHADHRMKSVNFFIVTVAFLTAAYVTAIRYAHPFAAVGVCAVGFVLTICFSRFELRIRELIKASEIALRPLQAKLAERTSVDAFKLFDIVEKGDRPFTRYSKVIGALHITAAAMFIGGAIYAIYEIFQTTHLNV